jgi:adenosine deaminase
VTATSHTRRWLDVTNADHARVTMRFSDGVEAEFVQSSLAAALKPRWYVLGTLGRSWGTGGPNGDRPPECSRDVRATLTRAIPRSDDAIWPQAMRQRTGRPPPDSEEAPFMDTEAFIRSIPKAELHLHIEGTLEPELKFALAARNGVELPYASADAMRAAYDFDDLASFLRQYYEGMSVLRAEEDFHDLAMAYFERVSTQGVVYAELFFDPQAHTSRGIAFETVIAGLRRGQSDARARFGIGSQLIMCFLRDHPVESAFRTLEQAEPFRDWIVGVGLDSDERDNPPRTFRDVFAEARARGYRLTMHCDVDQADSVDHIRQCLDEIRVERIDHGVNAIEDDALVDDLVRRGIGLTTCPISNSYVSDGTKAREIHELLRRGVAVTVNSDDPAYFPGYVADNLVTLQREAGLVRDELVRLVRNSFEISWLDPAERAAHLDRLDAWLASA